MATESPWTASSTPSKGGGSGLLVALDLTTGDMLWKTRTPKSNFLVAGGRLLILEENGALVLARPKEGGVETLGRINLLRYNAWTVPTLVGRRLYARDRNEIVAVELP